MGAVLVTGVGVASGSRAAASALACAASEADRAALLIDMSGGMRPRASLFATAAAQELEERIAAHLPQVRVGSRGQVCQLAVSEDAEGVEQASAALAVASESQAVVHLAPAQVHLFLESSTAVPSAALLRADLPRDRALAALAAGSLMATGLRVAILKAPPAWLLARSASIGLPLFRPGCGLPPRLCARLLTAPGTAPAWRG